MIARAFRPVGWVAAVGSAALCCYMLSLNVAAERAELEAIERQIIATKQDIRALQTELGTRGRLAQLDQWNAEILALSAPTSAQFVANEFKLASFERREQAFEEKTAVQLASAETHAQAAPAAPTIVFAAAQTPPAHQAQALVRRAAVVSMEEKPPVSKAVSPKKNGLLDAKLLAEIEKTVNNAKQPARGAGGQ